MKPGVVLRACLPREKRMQIPNILSEEAPRHSHRSLFPFRRKKEQSPFSTRALGCPKSPRKGGNVLTLNEAVRNTWRRTRNGLMGTTNVILCGLVLHSPAQEITARPSQVIFALTKLVLVTSTTTSVALYHSDHPCFPYCLKHTSYSFCSHSRTDSCYELGMPLA